MARSLDDLIGKIFAVGGVDYEGIGRINFTAETGLFTPTVVVGSPGEPTTLNLALATAGLVDVQKFTTTGVGQWTKPVGAKLVHAIAIGAGGGGGSAAGAGARGGGGGSGGMASASYDSDDLAATEAILVGAGGAIGLPGGDSIFSFTFNAVRGLGGFPGDNAGNGGQGWCGGGAGNTAGDALEGGYREFPTPGGTIGTGELQGDGVNRYLAGGCAGIGHQGAGGTLGGSGVGGTGWGAGGGGVGSAPNNAGGGGAAGWVLYPGYPTATTGGAGAQGIVIVLTYG